MSLRSALLALLLLTTGLAVITPTAAAEDPVLPVCGDSGSPAPLDLGVPVLGNDASAATPAAGLATGDCFFTVAVPGGSLANVGKELQLSIASAENHDLFIKRGAAAPLAAPYVCSSAVTTATTDGCRVYWPLTQPTYSVRVARIAAGTGDFTITASLVDAPASGCSHGYDILPLALGTAQAVTVGQAAGSRCYFSFQPNPGDDVAKVVGTGLPPSLGSYVIAKGGDVPTPTTVPGSTVTGDYGCSPPISGTTRTCAGSILPGETWYAVLVRGTAITTAPTPFGITASSLKACSLGTGIIDIALDTPVTGSVDGSAAAQSCRFRLPVDQPESLSKWSVVSNGANVDLYTRAGQPVVTGVFDCGSAVTSVTGTDVCALPVAGVSDVYGSVYRPAAGATLGSFSLTVSAVEGCPALGPDVTELADNVPVAASVADLAGAACLFHYVPSPDDSTVRVVATPSVGSQTLLVRRGSQPTSSLFDCSAAASPGVPAVCDLENLGDEIFVQLRRASGAGEASVTALGLSPCSLGGGDVLLGAAPVSASLTDDEGGSCRFKFVLPAADGDGASFTMEPADGDFDLFVRKASRPTAAAFDCRSSTADLAIESCLSVLDAGTYYAMVQRVSGSGAFSIRAEAVSTCSLGPAASPLAKGVAATGSLMDVVGAKCVFAFTPGNPLANPANPAPDIVKLTLSQDSADNFDLYLRKAAVPTTANRDCQSIQAAGATDACELIVADGSTYYGLVSRTSGGGPFSLVATTSHSCALGSGYHALPNGQELQSSTRAVAGVTKCYFSLPSLARDDLLSIVQEAKTANTGYTLTLSQDAPIGTGPASCAVASSWISIPSLGINLNSLAQCDKLLEDGLPHLWYVSVSRTATTGAADIQFAIKGTAAQIPTLVPGVPQVGHVDTGGVQYWKVVLPEHATFLDIQTAADPANLGCGLGSGLSSYVALACTLLPFPKLVGCAVAAGYGVSCDQAELTLAQRCAAETGDPATCAQIEEARLAACAAANDLNPGTCLPADTSGSVSGTCGILNRQTGEPTCDPLGTSVKLTEMDLVVRHRFGLPTSTVHDCRSATAGAAERCLFSADVKELHDNTTEPARADANQQVQDLRGVINGNRTALDQALTDLKDAIAENRTSLLEPLWALIRELVLALTGTDPGALPATPAVPATPATPNAVIPDQTNALPLPGPGKYFIAVRGPLDAASSLYYQGGDYAIVALHDDVQVPTKQALEDQVAAAITEADQGLGKRCFETSPQPALCGTIGALVYQACLEVGSRQGCNHLDGSLSGTCWIVKAYAGDEVCPDLHEAVAAATGLCGDVLGDAACEQADGSQEGTCGLAQALAGEDVCAFAPAVPGLPESPPSDPVQWVLDQLGLG